MSWIEDPGVEQFGSYVLTELGIDQAYLNVSAAANRPLWLYSLSGNCHTCPYQRVGEENTTVSSGDVHKINTKYKQSYRLRTDGREKLVAHDADDSANTFCDIGPVTMGEFGVYELRASSPRSSTLPKSSSFNNDNNLCEFNEIRPPVNVHYPILIALIAYVVIALVYNIYAFFLRRRKRLSSTNSGTSSSSIGGSDNSTHREQPSWNQQQGAGIQHGRIVAAEPPSKPQPQRQRLMSLDTFRGISIVIMIFVNDGGAAYYFFEHAAWDGLYVADLVFPWFLWIMGVCIPISIKSQRKQHISRFSIFGKILVRSLKLIGLGLVLGSIHGSADPESIRIPGVLQRFGLCYLVCSTLTLLYMNVNFTKPGANNKIKAALQDVEIIWIGWVAILILVTVHCLVTFFLQVPGCPTGYLGPGGMDMNGAWSSSCIGGATGYVDRFLLSENHIYRWPTANEFYAEGGVGKPFDPEGLLGTLTSFLQVWLGIQAGVTMLVYPNAWSRIKRWMIWSVGLGGIGALLCGARQYDGWIPINKNLWSLSFVLVTSSFALILLSALYWIIDMKKVWTGAPFKQCGMNSILLFVGHHFAHSCLPFHWSFGKMNTHAIRLLESLWGVSLWAIIAVWCHRKKLYWVL